MAHDTLPDLPSLSELRVFRIHKVVFATMVESFGTGMSPGHFYYF